MCGRFVLTQTAAEIEALFAIMPLEGGLALVRGREHYLLETSLTWPDGTLNWLACPGADTAGQEWRVTKAALTALITPVLLVSRTPP